VFFSRAIASHHAKQAAYERKLISLIKEVRHWQLYLWMRSFVVCTDHFSLKYLLDQRLPTIPQHAWVNKLFSYQFSIKFKLGCQNVAADALSHRHEEDTVVHALSLPNFALLDEFYVEAATLPEMIAKCAELTADTAGPEWALVDNLVIRCGHLFLPASASIWPLVLEHAHGMGHEGMQKTLQRLCSSFFMPGDNRMVRDFIRGCTVCQWNKTSHLYPAGLLQPLVVPTGIWRDITLDFIEGFRKVGGKLAILMVVGWFLNYAHFITLGHPYSATMVAKAFFDTIIRLHNVSESIINDRDPVLTSMMWKELFWLTDTKLCTSSTFHPQTDDQSEIANKIITAYLCCLPGNKPRLWLRWLPWTEFCFNSSYQMALKVTPFKVVYGRAPLSPVSISGWHDARGHSGSTVARP
jgi:hypothetical protein